MSKNRNNKSKNEMHRINDKKNSLINKINSDVWAWLVIILLSIIIYSNAFKCAFVFDDHVQIVDNEKIRNISDVNAWWNYSKHRPISMFTFALNYHFHGLNVWYYHLSNLLVHLLCTFFLWKTTILLFSSPAIKNSNLSVYKKNIAFFTALLFVSHPLATQSVTYIVQRMTSLAAMFYFLSIVLYLLARIKQNTTTVKFLMFLGAFIAALLAFLSKENTYTLPFVIILIEICFFQKFKNMAFFKGAKFLIPLILLICFFSFLILRFSINIFETIPASADNDAEITPVSYLLTQFSVIIKYIQLLIFPLKQSLDYDYSIAQHFFELTTFISFLVLLSLLIFAVYLFRKNSIYSFGIFWFFITLSIESSIIPIKDVIFEHRTYLPSYGFFIIVSTLLYSKFYLKNKTLTLSVFIIIISVNAYLTYQRNKVWQNEYTLWSDVIEKYPKRIRAYNNLGFFFIKTGQPHKTISVFNKLLKMDTTYASAYINRGSAFNTLGDYDKALIDFSNAILYDSTDENAFYNRGIALANLGKFKEAITDYSKAISINSKHTNSYLNRGVAYAGINMWENAKDDFNNAIINDTNNIDAIYNRGYSFLQIMDCENAIKDLSKVVSLNASYYKAYYDLGIALFNCNRYYESLTNFNMVLTFDNNYMFTQLYLDSIKSKTF